MKFTNPKQGITVSIPDGMSPEDLIVELRRMADDKEKLQNQPVTRKSVGETADKIGRAASDASYRDIEYIISDNVDQMVLLYAILIELRKMNGLR